MILAPLLASSVMCATILLIPKDGYSLQDLDPIVDKLMRNGAVLVNTFVMSEVVKLKDVPDIAINSLSAQDLNIAEVEFDGEVHALEAFNRHRANLANIVRAQEIE